MKKAVSFVALTAALMCTSISIVGSGKPPGNDVPLRITIAGNPNVPDSYRIVGDGRDYVDGQEGVYAKFQVDNGSNDFIMDPTDKGVSAPRALWFDFADKIANGSATNPWFGSGMSKIDTYLNFNDIYSVPVGQVEERTGGFGQIFFGNGKRRTMYRVAFNNDPSAPNYLTINAPNFVSPILVSHPDCNTWILTPKAVVYNDFGFGAGSGAVSTLLYFLDPPQSAGQYLLPFQFTLTRKVPITCP